MRKSCNAEHKRQYTPSEPIGGNVGVRNIESNVLGGTLSDSRTNGCLDEGKESKVFHTVTKAEERPVNVTDAMRHISFACAVIYHPCFHLLSTNSLLSSAMSH